MPELFFRLERGQLTRMRTLALVFLLLTVGGAAPMTSLLFADPGFDAKFGQIVKAWRAQRR